MITKPLSWSVLRALAASGLFFFALAETAANAQRSPANGAPLLTTSGELSAKAAPLPWNSLQAFVNVEDGRLATARRSINALLAVKGRRTVENTLIPFDEAIYQIHAADYLAGLMLEVHPDVAVRDRSTEMKRKANAASTAMSLNRGVFQALKNLDLSRSDPATRHYVERQLLLSRQSGVDRDGATRTRLKELNDEHTEHISMFNRNIADSRTSIELADVSELEGLPADYIEHHKSGADGKIHITSDYPDALPVMKFANSDSLRRRMFAAFYSRAYPQNRDLLLRMIRTRYEMASLLGYSSWADYFAADKMIDHAAKIADFLQRVDAAALPIEKREMEMLLAEKQKIDPGAKEIWDYEVSYLSELVRRSKFNLDAQTVRPYLPYAHVKQGIIDIAAKLFHVSFRQELDAIAWHPSVETWDVLDNGNLIGRFYLDMHPRPGKTTHNKIAGVLDGARGKQVPEAALICNFPAPTDSDPALMDYTDVVIFFHEFGHLMHWILGGQLRWAGISGLSTELDFAEAPSQLLEEWMRSLQVLAVFARHYQTGEPIPAELVERMNRASEFGRGIWVSQQVRWAAISYDLHKGPPQAVNLDAVSRDDTLRYTRFTPLPDTHMYASFVHLGFYFSSTYYTYLWDKVIAEDFFTRFDRANLLAAPAALRYRHLVLEPGGSIPASELVKNFLGRPPNMRAFRRWMEEEFEPPRRGRPGEWRPPQQSSGPTW